MKIKNKLLRFLKPNFFMAINKVVIEGIKKIEYGNAFFALLNNDNLSALDSFTTPSESVPKLKSK